MTARIAAYTGRFDIDREAEAFANTTSGVVAK